MKKENVSTRTKTKEQKEQCFFENKEVLDICYYLCEGFFIRKQMYQLMYLLYDIPEKETREKVKMLCSYGLLKESQVNYSNTKLCVMGKFATSLYYENKSSRDIPAVKLNNKKIIESIYRTEFLIQKVIPLLEKNQIELTIEDILYVCKENAISIYTKSNQEDVYELYNKLHTMNAFSNSFYEEDYNISICEYLLYSKNFLHTEIPYEDFDKVLQLKQMRDKERMQLVSNVEKNKYYYNLFNMVGNGFFFRFPPNGTNIKVGIFDIGNLTVEKLYKQTGFLYSMLQRYLAPDVTLDVQVYLSTKEKKDYLLKKETSKSFDMKRQEWRETNKRETYLRQTGIREQYLENIEVTYINFDLKEKYNI